MRTQAVIVCAESWTSRIECASTCRCAAQSIRSDFNAEHVRQRLDVTFPTASAAVMMLEAIGIVAELNGQKRTRICSYMAFVRLLSP